MPGPGFPAVADVDDARACRAWGRDVGRTGRRVAHPGKVGSATSSATRVHVDPVVARLNSSPSEVTT